MPTKKRLLAPHQVEVLEWIATGCPDGVMTGTSYKTTGAALQSRRLVKVSRKRGAWSAEITEDGRYYLQHGSYRETPRSHQPLRPKPKPTSAFVGEGERRVGQRGKAPVEALIEEVVAAGGELRVNTKEDRRQFSNLVKSAIRFGKVPEGKLLTVERGDGWYESVIRLSDPPAWQTAVLQPIAVPKQARSVHPRLAALHDDPRLTTISSRHRGRATRLLQALISEAERRGYSITNAERMTHYGRWGDRPWFGIEVGGHTIGIALRQIIDRVPHVPTAAELREKERYSWHRIPSKDDVPSDRLTIKVTNGREYRQSAWSDGKKARLEDLLAQVLQEVELRAEFEEQKRMEEDRARAERRQKWEDQMERAKRELQEQHRAEVLVDSARRWQQTSMLRAYLDALTDNAKSLEDLDARAAARDWIEWCRAYVDRTDPLAHKIAAPDPIQPTAERLTPFMAGLSPYGPPT